MNYFSIKNYFTENHSANLQNSRATIHSYPECLKRITKIISIVKVNGVRITS